MQGRGRKSYNVGRNVPQGFYRNSRYLSIHAMQSISSAKKELVLEILEITNPIQDYHRYLAGLKIQNIDMGKSKKERHTQTKMVCPM